MKTVTAYQCDFCPQSRRRARVSKTASRKHEERCFYNPETRACATCDHLYTDGEGETRCHGGSETSKTTLQFTGKLTSGCRFWKEASNG